MLRSFHRLESFGAKLVWVITVTSGLAVLVVASIGGIRDYYELRNQLTETVAAQTMIVAMNSSAPLAFRDPESAAEALAAFRVAESVSRVFLVDADGQVFARYGREGSADAEVILPEGHWERSGDRVLVVEVADRSGSHGRLQVHYTAGQLRRQALFSALLTAVLSAGAMLLAWLVARGLETVLAAPVRELERTAQQVAETDDYSIRARKFGNDELGRFTDRFNAMLGHVEGSRDELLRAHRNAEEANRLKDEFVATLSHELRTPMSPILAWTQMLRLKRDDIALEQGLEVIERNARLLVQIIDDLLDMSRIISGNLRLDVQPLNLADIIRGAIETVRSAAESRQVRLQLVVDPVAGTVRGDPARLQQVLWNLLSNAIKFTPKGGRVQISLQQVNSHIEIAIADTGIGIAADFLPFVFERFRQADGSTTREHTGLGLGLAIVKQLVELHGGTVHAASDGLGNGATFLVCLPLSALQALPVEGVRQQPRDDTRVRMLDKPPSLAGIDVLVVEDQSDMRELIRGAVVAAGGSAREAESMTEALRCFDDKPPDILVSDIGMPGGDGYELIRAIRQRPATTGGRVPAIALTAFARSEDRTRAMLAGYQLHVAKPVEPLELLAAISSLALNSAQRVLL